MLLLILRAAGAVWAQAPTVTCTLSLSGRMADHESRVDLPGATVVVLETQ